MNLRPPGYEPDELPACSTPRYKVYTTLFKNASDFEKYLFLIYFSMLRALPLLTPLTQFFLLENIFNITYSYFSDNLEER